MIGTDISIEFRQLVYVLFKIFSKFGVNGLRIDLVIGNIAVDFFYELSVLAPNPKIARLVMFA